MVLSDGADNSRAPIGDELLSLRAKSVPIFTVGLGADKFDKDIEIRRVEAVALGAQGRRARRRPVDPPARVTPAHAFR